MKSFRSEIENPIVDKDILELNDKIQLFNDGKINEERFRTLRLARGIYGQRQVGVQMIRIKIPYGQLNSRKLERISDVSEEYSTGRLHITTRQDFQIHNVELDRTPELWAELEKDEITIREACGNTVRNITSSSTSGIDPDEVFDVRPFAEATFTYFLRNPICQEMGRKFKFSFSTNDSDTALSYIHDLGFIAKTNANEQGFKVMVAGGLGSQSRHADVLYEFLPTNKLIPVSEAVLRVFDHYGERTNRMKARLKFLVKDIGIETFKRLVDAELLTLDRNSVDIEYKETTPSKTKLEDVQILKEEDLQQFEAWKSSNVISQKQSGLNAIGVKVQLGDFTTKQARKLTEVIKFYSGDEITLTIDQNLLIRHVVSAQLPRFFYLLRELDLANAGYEKSADITACPGTDTCNLGIANSTSLTRELENVLRNEYPQYVHNKIVTIKISGCMNSCGQHMIANIGFQGMSIRAKDKRVLPAVQLLLGGGAIGNGKGRFADKVIKLPSKRALAALRLILNEFEQSEFDEFISFYDHFGEKFFYDLLKPLAQIELLDELDFMDWGQTSNYRKEIGIGECAGVVIDLVSTLLSESEDKLALGEEAYSYHRYADSLYHTYSAVINTAKALLIAEGKRTNSHHSIVQQFEDEFIHSKKIQLNFSFTGLALGIAKAKPSKEKAKQQLIEAMSFCDTMLKYRKETIKEKEPLVI